MRPSKIKQQQRQRRYRMAVAYLDRRRSAGVLGTGQWCPAYLEWVDAFPTFMMIAYPGALIRSRERDERQARKAANYRPIEARAVLRAKEDQRARPSQSRGRTARPALYYMGDQL